MSHVACLDETDFAASRHVTANTDSCGGYPCLDELHEGTAAGIYDLRRLKFKRCGELALGLSSHLTFASGISQPFRKSSISKMRTL